MSFIYRSNQVIYWEDPSICPSAVVQMFTNTGVRANAAAAEKGQYFTLVNQKVRRQISNLSILKSFLMPLSCHIIPALSTGIKALFNDNILKKKTSLTIK